MPPHHHATLRRVGRRERRLRRRRRGRGRGGEGDGQGLGAGGGGRSGGGGHGGGGGGGVDDGGGGEDGGGGGGGEGGRGGGEEEEEDKAGEAETEDEADDAAEAMEDDPEHGGGRAEYAVGLSGTTTDIRRPVTTATCPAVGLVLEQRQLHISAARSSSPPPPPPWLSEEAVEGRQELWRRTKKRRKCFGLKGGRRKRERMGGAREREKVAWLGGEVGGAQMGCVRLLDRLGNFRFLRQVDDWKKGFGYRTGFGARSESPISW
ncbi:hypothetical protein GW17_00023089 [Ensete ventricosum]|nr:hypothetical protein GW17_00023089 [Ensete ventricosum]